MKPGIRWGLVIFITPVLVWLALLIILPQVDMFIMSIRAENELGEMGFSIANFKLFFSEPIYWRTIARTAIFSILYNDTTMIMGLVYTTMLFMLVPLLSVLESLDNSLIEAAYDLGGSVWSIARRIVIPHCLPGIVSGSIVVFMLTLGNYLTPNLMGGKNGLWFTEQIYNQFIASFNWNQGSAFGFLLLILSSGIIWVGVKLTKQRLGKVVQ